MTKKVRKYILFFIVGLVQALFAKEGKSDAFILKCSNGQSAQKCCESADARYAAYGSDEGTTWYKSSKGGGYCSASPYL